MVRESCRHSLMMSAWVKKRTLRGVRLMSALPPKADIGTRPGHVRFVPKADIGPKVQLLPPAALSPLLRRPTIISKIAVGVKRVDIAEILFMRPGMISGRPALRAA